MSDPIAAYSFLPWARQGLGTHLQDAVAGQLRGTVQVAVTLRGTKVDKSADAIETVSRPVQLYGPGDIVGVDARAIFRTEPRHWITNFESNYLPFVEFVDEDFCWRYTPAAPSPDQRRLTPWLTLAVLEEGEFEDGGNIVGRPLSFITVADAATKLPPADQLWAWAHVHVDGALGGDRGDTAGLARRLEQTLAADRDRAFSRLMSPRALKPNAAYHAFVIPTFESGRLAGLGLDPAGASSATQVAWSAAGALELPFYHRWYFRTGSAGDFEYLVRLLVPQPVDPRVGSRDMDVQAPGSGLPAIMELDGLLRLGGALRAPVPTPGTPDHAEWERWEHWAMPYPRPFQVGLAEFLNLPDTYARTGVQDAAGNDSLEDPLIAPPIYGRWHAAVSTLDPQGATPSATNWVHELNLDPRFRTGAGFGTRVIQQQQEAYMEDAWKQVGEVLAANQRIRYAHMAMAVSGAWQLKHLAPLVQRQPERYLAVAAPVQRRVLAEGLTVHQRFALGTVPPAMLAKVARQVLRPRARVAKRVGLDGTRRLDNLMARVDRGDVIVVPRKTVPAGLPTGDRIAGTLQSGGLPETVLEPIRRVPLLRWLPLLIALLLLPVWLALGPIGWLLGALSIAAAVAFARRAISAIAVQAALDTLRAGGTTPQAVDALPASPDFRIDAGPAGPAPTIESGGDGRGGSGGASAGSADSEDARRFKAALRNVALADQATGALPVVERKSLDLTRLARITLEALRPERTIPAWTRMHVAIPPRIRDAMVEEFGEVMVYPVIDTPMYEPLKDLSGELFVPNLQLIPANSITLLETNQKFIEAYMVGLNHEFSRELLWREYPTDQRGSYFRQFWDVRGFLADPSLDADALRERLRDIPELHRWSLASELGDHDHREAQGDKEEEIVLVIRGELLKKYPTAVIYAHRAEWEPKADGSVDKARPRKLKDLGAQAAQPPRDLVKTPLYEAKVDPDIYFFGFDITVPKARGGVVPPGGTEEDPGWFFVIKERPGEPRFGLDLAKGAPQAVLGTWNDLAWSDVMTPYAPGQFLRAGGGAPPALSNPGGEALAQFDDDKAYRWRPDTHAAELAYILYQVPVLMAVHAAEMLPKA